MLDVILPIVLFIIGLVCLIKGGDWFVDGSTGLARRFHIPEILIGATIVSIGTTLPEVMVSATGAIQGSSAMAFGNAVGSVICNTALIAAITMTIRPSKVDRKPLVLPVCFFFGAAIFYVLTAVISGEFNRITGIILLCVFVAYMVISAISMKKHGSENSDEEHDETEKVNPLWKDIVLLLIGAALIAVGAKLLVDNGTKIATLLGVPDTVIALTFVALGTSLPELITAITALIKGHSALSLGNIIGANLFNIVLVSGVSVTLKPFALPEGVQLFGMNASFIMDIPVMMAVMTLLTVPTLLTGKLKRYQGIILLLIYFSYVTLQFVIGGM